MEAYVAAISSGWLVLLKFNASNGNMTEYSYPNNIFGATTSSGKISMNFGNHETVLCDFMFQQWHAMIMPCCVC